MDQVSRDSNTHTYNLDRSCSGAGLTRVGSKLLNIEQLGTGSDSLIFVHGLGGNTVFPPPHRCSGPGKIAQVSPLRPRRPCLSPAKADSVVTINSYAEDPSAIYSHSSLNTKSSVLIAHSIGCLVAITFALKNPSLVSKLILIGPPPSPLSEVTASAQIAHGKAVREAGMRTSGVAEAATTARISSKTKSERIVAISRSKR